MADDHEENTAIRKALHYDAIRGKPQKTKWADGFATVQYECATWSCRCNARTGDVGLAKAGLK